MAYFDNAATTFPKPDSVYEFMSEFYKNSGANAGRGNYSMAKTTEKKKDFIDKLASMSHNEINDFIKRNGKPRKTVIMCRLIKEDKIK